MEDAVSLVSPSTAPSSMPRGSNGMRRSGPRGRVSGRPVRSIHYPDVDRLGPGPVVLSGSGAPWDRHDPAELERLGDAVRAADAPVLGICAGLQLLTGFAGGRVEPMAVHGRPPERGYLQLEVLDSAASWPGSRRGPPSSRTTWTRSRSCPRTSASSRERPVARSRRSRPRSGAGGGRSSTPSVSTPIIQTGGG